MLSNRGAALFPHLANGQHADQKSLQLPTTGTRTVALLAQRLAFIRIVTTVEPGEGAKPLVIANSHGRRQEWDVDLTSDWLLM